MTPAREPTELVVMGASWGGLAAVECLLDQLPPDFCCPVVLVQHRLEAPSALAGLLARHVSWVVHEAHDKEPIRPSSMYLAPPGYHLLVEPGHLELSTEAPVAHSRPSIDVTFCSAADAYASRVVGIVLTGANADGAAGLAEIARRGGAALVQDPATASQPAMPSAALAAVPDAEVLDLPGIAQRLAELCTLEREP